MSGHGHPPSEGERSSLASELLDRLEAGRHYSTLVYTDDREPVEVVWNYDREAGQPWQRDDFSDRDESERRRELAIRHQNQYVADAHEPTEQTTLITDGGERTGDTERRWCNDCEHETPHRQVGDATALGPTYQCLGCPERIEIEAALGGGRDV